MAFFINLIKNIFRKKDLILEGLREDCSPKAPGARGRAKTICFHLYNTRAYVERDSGLHIRPVSRFYYLSEYFIARKPFVRFWSVLEPLNENA